MVFNDGLSDDTKVPLLHDPEHVVARAVGLEGGGHDAVAAGHQGQAGRHLAEVDEVARARDGRVPPEESRVQPGLAVPVPGHPVHLEADVVERPAVVLLLRQGHQHRTHVQLPVERVSVAQRHKVLRVAGVLVELSVLAAAAGRELLPRARERLHDGPVSLGHGGPLRRQVADLDEAEVLDEVAEAHVELAVVGEHQLQAVADVIGDIAPLGVTIQINTLNDKVRGALILVLLLRAYFEYVTQPYDMGYMTI